MNSVVVITTRIDADLHASAKRKAKADGRSLANYLRRLIEQDLLQRHFSDNGHGISPTGHIDGRAILHAVNRDC